MVPTDSAVPCDIITVDVEEWFHGHNYLDRVPPEVWENQEQRVEKGMGRCLDLLDAHGVKGTFSGHRRRDLAGRLPGAEFQHHPVGTRLSEYPA